MRNSMNNDLSLSMLNVVFTCLDIAYIGHISVNQYLITVTTKQLGRSDNYTQQLN